MSDTPPEPPPSRAMTPAPAGSPFHPGELDAQRRAGVEREAARLAHMLEPPSLDARVAGLLAERTFAAMTARDGEGRLWTSPLSGPPGFLHVASPTTLEVGVVPPPGDPLHLLPGRQPVGILVIDFATRRRVRINGTLTDSGAEQLAVEVEQAYGNCPQYIVPRSLRPASGRETVPHEARALDALEPDDVEQIRAASTFFLGTTHPQRGNDASHKGGPPGFVRVEDGMLWWPDFPGNNMFNSFGNLLVDDEAALLFPDFVSGRALHLSGHAEVCWDDGDPLQDPDHSRRVVVTPTVRVVGPPLPARES